MSLPLRDWIALIAIAGGAALAAGVAGGVVLHVTRRRSFFAQVAIVALTSTVTVAVGALAAGSAMFISPHDFTALSVVIVVAGRRGAGGVCARAPRRRGQPLARQDRAAARGP